MIYRVLITGGDHAGLIGYYRGATRDGMCYVEHFVTTTVLRVAPHHIVTLCAHDPSFEPESLGGCALVATHVVRTPNESWLMCAHHAEQIRLMNESVDIATRVSLFSISQT